MLRIPCNVILDTGNNYTTTLRNTNNLDQYLGKVDYTISPKDTIFGDYQYANAPIIEPSYVPNLFGRCISGRAEMPRWKKTTSFHPRC